MNILITGCNGQLGSEIRQLEPLHSAHTFYNTDIEELDIANQLAVEDYVNRYNIDGIVNCAAYTAVDKAESEKELCTTLNTIAPSYLAAAIGKRGGWMIHISTDYVFNGNHYLPYLEDDTPCPDSVYGNTKLAGELGVRKFCPNTLIIRTAWLYSRYGRNFVKTMMRLGKEKDSIGVVYDQIGTPTCAGDLAEAILSIIEQGVHPGLYHFSNEGVTSWYDFTIAIHRLAGINSCKVKPIHTDEYPTAATRPAYSVLDKTKIKQDYGLSIPHWETSLAKTIEQIKETEQ
jgi:dTDP-4-dehydrorhamnose reductase